MGDVGGKCLIFSDYGAHIRGREEFGLMAVIEIFRSEMEYAKDQQGRLLIRLMK